MLNGDEKSRERERESGICVCARVGERLGEREREQRTNDQRKVVAPTMQREKWLWSKERVFRGREF